MYKTQYKSTRCKTKDMRPKPIWNIDFSFQKFSHRGYFFKLILVWLSIINNLEFRKNNNNNNAYVQSQMTVYVHRHS